MKISFLLDVLMMLYSINIQGGPKVGIQLLKVGFGSKSRFVVLM